MSVLDDARKDCWIRDDYVGAYFEYRFNGEVLTAAMPEPIIDEILRLRDGEAALLARCAELERKLETSAINIVFDGPPAPESGRFVEVETDDGYSINAGDWIERPDGLWALRITKLPKKVGAS